MQEERKLNERLTNKKRKPAVIHHNKGRTLESRKLNNDCKAKHLTGDEYVC